MSGVGKSSVVTELLARGYRAVDLDDGWCRPQPDGGQIIDEERVVPLLDEETPELFLAGCEENQVNLYDRLNKVVLLSAPVDLMLERVRRRHGNPYGRTEAERARIVADTREIEPLLRRSADHVVETDRPLTEVVDELLSILRLPLQMASSIAMAPCSSTGRSCCR
ncbi:shikimate kinase [Pseudonocardia sp. MH-G8]|nr:shikimate kinase [Pseudonocardia sp. MH-G8]